jgi:hypothetical protein
MRSTMSCSERFCSGFALAATIAGDPGAEQAQSGLAEPLREPASKLARELLKLSKAERRARVSALLKPRNANSATADGSAWPTWPTEARPPVRAYALLARSEPASHLPTFVHAAPLPRAGFTPEPGLVSLLRRIAFASRPESEAAPSDGGEPWGG